MKDDRRAGDDRPRRERARGGRSEVLHHVPRTTVRVVRDAATGRVYLTADDDLRPRTARIYTNWDGDRLRDAMAPDDTILEHRGELTGEEAAGFRYTVTEYIVDEKLAVTTRVVHREVVTPESSPRDEDTEGFGYGVNLLVEEWINLDPL